MLAAGWLGRKSGRGFYDYAEGAARPEPRRDEALGDAVVRRVVAMLVMAKDCKMGQHVPSS